MMLCVIVYRNDPETIQRIHGTTDPNHALRMHQTVAQGSGPMQSPGTPTPPQGGFSHPGRPSISAPAFSPTSPQGPFPPQYPSPRMGTPMQQPQPPPAPAPQPARQTPKVDDLQRQGEAIAREVLGHLITSPTVMFLLPQAHVMSRREWEVIKKVYERDPKTRDDLPYLSTILEKEGQQQQQQTSQTPPLPQAPQQPQPHPQQQQHRPQPQQHLPPQHHPQRPPQPQQQHPHPMRTTPIPPPPIPPAPVAGPPKQTPIPPPPIPPQATAGSGPPPA